MGEKVFDVLVSITVEKWQFIITRQLNVEWVFRLVLRLAMSGPRVVAVGT
jgi:hypothetical protein